MNLPLKIARRYLFGKNKTFFAGVITLLITTYLFVLFYDKFSFLSFTLAVHPFVLKSILSIVIFWLAFIMTKNVRLVIKTLGFLIAFIANYWLSSLLHRLPSPILVYFSPLTIWFIFLFLITIGVIAKHWQKISFGAVNIITSIASFGVAIGATALILVLSVFNGFEDLFLSLYNNFNPDITITPTVGKTFEPDSTVLAQLRAMEAIEIVSEVLEEKALFEYKNNQDLGLLKGVDQEYHLVGGIDSTVREGEYQIHLSQQATAVVGLGIRNKLGIDVDAAFNNLTIHVPKRKNSGFINPRPFNSRTVIPTGTFLVQQDFENQYVITSIEIVRQLLNKRNTCSAFEVRLAPGFDIPETYEAVRSIMGENFVIKDRYEQEASFLRLMRIEKWLSFAIVGLMMLMISFNLIGALWMIVLEKQKDIAILKSMGMTNQGVNRLFLLEGLLLCGYGLVCGFLLALVLFQLQRTIGIITLPGGMLIDAYPVSLRWYDFPVVSAAVLGIGFLASILPARRAKRVSTIIHAE